MTVVRIAKVNIIKITSKLVHPNLAAEHYLKLINLYGNQTITAKYLKGNSVINPDLDSNQ